MKTYKIVNAASGVELGTYKGETEEDALDAMAMDAGYADHEDAQRVAPCDTIQVTEVSLQDWRWIPMTDGRRDIPGDNHPDRVRALAEYRENGSIYGVWLCSTEALESADGEDDTATLGPSVDEIDWTGFPEE